MTTHPLLDSSSTALPGAPASPWSAIDWTTRAAACAAYAQAHDSREAASLATTCRGLAEALAALDAGKLQAVPPC
jgi:hypothetical protein